MISVICEGGLGGELKGAGWRVEERVKGMRGVLYSVMAIGRAISLRACSLFFRLQTPGFAEFVWAISRNGSNTRHEVDIFNASQAQRAGGIAQVQDLLYPVAGASDEK